MTHSARAAGINGRLRTTPADHAAQDGCWTPACLTWACALMFLALFVVPARAQSSGQTGMSPESGTTIVQQVLAAPPPGKWGASATVGLMWLSGRTETTGVSASGYVAHSTRARDLVRFDAGSSFASVVAVRGTPAITVSDNQRVTLDFVSRPMRGRFTVLGITGWRRDAILSLRHRLWAEGGLGVSIANTKRLAMIVGTSLAVGNEARGVSSKGSAVRDIGFLEMLNTQLTPALSVQQSFEVRRYLGARDDITMSFNAAALARVSKHVGISIRYLNQYDELFPPGSAARQAEFSVGVRLDFQPPRPQAPPAPPAPAK